MKESALFGTNGGFCATNAAPETSDADRAFAGTPLDPDFLFNTLNAVSSLMHRDVEAADRVVSRLSEMLRISLALAGREEVPLRDEVDLLERYVEIQQARFPGKLAVALRIESAALDFSVPGGILQSLVERAVGRGSPPGFRRIEVVAGALEQKLELRVRDRGKREDPNPRLVEDVGLDSTRRRLERLYGTDYRIEIRNGFTGCVSVTLFIPLRMNVQEDSHGHTESGLENPGADRR